jgi:hypothetical protein
VGDGQRAVRIGQPLPGVLRDLQRRRRHGHTRLVVGEGRQLALRQVLDADHRRGRVGEAVDDAEREVAQRRHRQSARRGGGLLARHQVGAGQATEAVAEAVADRPVGERVGRPRLDLGWQLRARRLSDGAIEREVQPAPTTPGPDQRLADRDQRRRLAGAGTGLDLERHAGHRLLHGEPLLVGEPAVL